MTRPTAIAAPEEDGDRLYQGECECGWLGVWRDTLAEAQADIANHVQEEHNAA